MSMQQRLSNNGPGTTNHQRRWLRISCLALVGCWAFAGIGLALTSVPTGFVTSCENQSIMITAVYQGILGRAPTAAELLGWSQRLSSGEPGFAVTAELLDSDEFADRMDDQTYLIYLFWRLLDRDPSASEFKAFREFLTSEGARSDTYRAMIVSQACRIRILGKTTLRLEDFLTFDPSLYEGYQETAQLVQADSGNFKVSDSLLVLPKVLDYPTHSLHGRDIVPLTQVSEHIPVTEFTIYRGYLHSHSYFSEDAAPTSGHPSEAYEMARYEAGMDFLGVTDHGEFLEAWEWEELLWTAEDYTEEHAFLALAGFEYSNFLFGHICVVGTQEYSSMFHCLTEELFYEWLSGHPEAIATFNHPGEYDYIASEFLHFEHHPEVHDIIVGIEVIQNEGFEEFMGSYADQLNYFPAANYYGWRIGALSAQDNHSKNWGTRNDVRTGVFAVDLTTDRLFEAYRARRFFASEDLNLEVVFLAEGQIMGGILFPGEAQFSIGIKDADGETFVRLEAYRDGELIAAQDLNAVEGTWTFSVESETDNHFYYVWVYQEDGDRALTSPIFIKGTNPQPPPTPSYGACVVTVGAQEATTGKDLTNFYQLKETLTARNDQARACVAKFYRHSAEVVSILTNDPQAMKILQQLVARADELLKTETPIRTADLILLKRLIENLKPQASQELSQALDEFLQLFEDAEGKTVPELIAVVFA